MESNLIENYIEQINGHLVLSDFTDKDSHNKIKENISKLLEKLEVLNIIENDPKLIDFIDVLTKSIEFFEKLNMGISEKEKEKIYQIVSNSLTEILEKIRDYSEKVLKSEKKEQIELEPESESMISVDLEKSDEPQNETDDLNIEMDAEIFMDFFSETEEHLNNFEVMLMRLENNSEDIAAVNESFRGIHSIKGMAGFLNLVKINKLTHIMESLLDFFRDGIKIEEHLIDSLFKGLDVIRNLISNVSDKLNDRKYIFNKGEYDKVYNTIKKYVTEIEKNGKSQKVNLKPDFKNDITLEKIDDEESKPVSFSKNSVTSTSPQQEKKLSETIKVKVDRIDKLVNFIGELVIIHNQIQQRVNDKNDDMILTKNVSQMNRIINELQETSLSMRMVPIKGTFQKLNRMVRELSKQTGKQVDCKVLGEGTELDRNVIEELQDPLVHIIRNSMDHGIEDSELRIKNGKSEKGTVKLNAFHQSGMVIIEITDDGKGLNKEAIYNKAVTKGLIKNNETLTDKQIYKLIFNPGFSTAEKVTNISGRGVGMDVVKRNIDKIRGKIEVESEEGKGCKIQIKLPLTLAIIDGMIVRVGKENYVLPMLSILESICTDNCNVTKLPSKNEVIKVREKIYPLIKLNKVLGIENTASKKSDKEIIIIIQTAEKSFALLVDELIGQHQVVIKSLGKTFNKVTAFSGAAIMGDGKVGLILDLENLSKPTKN